MTTHHYTATSDAEARGLAGGTITEVFVPSDWQRAVNYYGSDPGTVIDYKATTGRPVTLGERVSDDLRERCPFTPGDRVGVKERWVRQGTQRKGTPHKLSRVAELDSEPCELPYPADTRPNWGVRTWFTVADVRPRQRDGVWGYTLTLTQEKN